MTKEQKDWIDNASYYTLFRNWRFAEGNNTIFMGEAGRYYTKVMKEKRNKLKPGEDVRISKSIGW